MRTSSSFRFERGGLIDRGATLSFSFNGVRLSGYAGDTLASALLANGARIVGRSFKFHRPRGILGAGAEESNALVCIGDGGRAEPNVRATLQPLYEGLTARSQNCWPSVNVDLGRGLDLVHRLWPSGFYHKTFMWPDWHWYEWAIRHLAGIGRMPPADDPDRYLEHNAHCDLLIVGAGPAGLAAALAAARAGKRIIVAEQESGFGGSLRSCPARIDGLLGMDWVAQAVAELQRHENVVLLSRAAVTACFDQQLCLISQRMERPSQSGEPYLRERLWKVRAGCIVLATGAIEQPLVFPFNDRPGVMLASAVRHYLGAFAVACGRSVVIAANNDAPYPLARQLQEAGIEVAGIVDSRAKPSAFVVRQLEGMQIPVFFNSMPIATAGAGGVSSVTVGRHTGGGAFRRTAMLDCDCLAMSGGMQPAVHLLSQARGSLRYDDALGAFLPDSIPDFMRVVGMCSGDPGLGSALQSGWTAGGGVVADAPVPNDPDPAPSDRAPIARVFVDVRSDRQWVDFQHDVTLGDIEIAVAENFSSVEHMKRFTTTGMALDQGKTSNINALAALAVRTGRTPGEVGTTTFRPFYLPVTLGALAGPNRAQFYAPVRRSPLFEVHDAGGARFQDYGLWRRPAAYPRGAEDLPAAIRREAVAARSGVALFDGSPLGKFEVRGRDAAEFLNRVYVNDFGTLATGRARYGIVLNENGIIIDDGIVVRRAEGHFLLHTTSSGAERMFAWLEGLLQGDWPELDVLLTPVTSEWANIAVSGPRSRDLLSRLGMDIDLTNGAFPHLHFREGRIDKVPVRLMRAGFTGELGFEINVPADFGASLWQVLLELGSDLGVNPIGVEALMLLRLEKGYLHVGSDTDGNTTPDDVGWSDAIARKRTDFLGRRALLRPANRASGRLQFVGLTPAAAGVSLLAGAHVVNAAHRSAPAPTEGYVTSAAFSPNLNRYVALGLVRDGRSRVGETVNVFDRGIVQPAVIAAPCSWDPEGVRLHA